MEGRVGRGVITLFLCLVLLSALLFIFFESNRSDPLAGAASLGSMTPPALVELVEPWAFTGPMTEYEFDLYRRTEKDAYEYVAPPALDYADSSALRGTSLEELGLATDEIDPASRETTIDLTLSNRPGTTPLPTPIPGGPTPTPAPVQLGRYYALTYYITPARKTVILDNGASTATVTILPDACDTYVAVRTPMGNIVFVSTFSHTRQNYTANPVPLFKNAPIARLNGPIFTFKMTSRNMPGHYKIYAVMVPPGANVWNPRNWISNLCAIRMNYGIVKE